MSGNTRLFIDGLTYHHTVDERVDEQQFRLHCHAMYEIYYFVRGSGQYLVESSIYTLCPADLVVLRPGESHRFIPTGDGVYERYSLHFDPSDWRDHPRLLEPFDNREAGQNNLLRPDATQFTALFCRLDETVDLPADLRVLMSRFLLGELLTSIAALVGERDSLIAGERINPHVAHLLGYINEHLTEPITLDRLAEQVFVSKHHISRVFKACIGVAPMEYVTNKRVLLARQCIRDGMHPTDAAQRCGFGDYSAFYRAYRRYTGLAPSARIPFDKEANYQSEPRGSSK